MTTSRKIATSRWWRYTFLFSFLLNVSLIITFVYGEGEDDTDIQEVQPVSTTSAPSISSSPSSIPTQDPNTNPCSSYRCGDYSAAKNLIDNINDFFMDDDDDKDGNNIFNDTNWTAVFEVKERSPFQFLKAGVSCAFDSDRMMFDNDFIKRNNPTDIVWDIQTSASTNSATGTNDLTYNNFNFTNFANNYNISSNNFTMEDTQSNSSSTTKKRRREKSFKIPNNIHINIYAIDDQLEFRYRSCPSDMITPVIDIIKQFEINNKTYGVNTTNLRFVWNKNAMTGGVPNYWEKTNPGDPNDGLRNVTLELWVPKWILETTTIICPQIDYTLGIKIGGTVDSGDGNYNNNSNKNNNETTTTTTTTTAATTNITNDTNIEEEGGDLPPLLTHGPPRSLTIFNFGIGTELVIDIYTSISTSTTTNNNTSKTTSGSGSDSDSSSNTSTNNSSINMLELLYIDQTLNSEVRIQTDQNVYGTILMVGSNMQAAIVSTEDSSQMISDGEKRDDGNGNGDGDDISITLNGFQQVVTVMGKYEEIILGGNSIALYTTEGCSEADRVTRPGVFTACFEIDPTNTSSYYSDELEVEVPAITVVDLAIIQESDGSLFAFQDSLTYVNFANVNVTGAKTNRRNNNPTPGGLKPLSPMVVLPMCLVATNISEFNCNPLSSGSTVSTTSITFSSKNNIWSYIAISIVIATTIINS